MRIMCFPDYKCIGQLNTSILLESLKKPTLNTPKFFEPQKSLKILIEYTPRLKA